MLAFMAANEVGTWSGDTGWTEIAAQTGNARPATRVAYKIAGASEGGSYTFTHSQPVDTETTGTILAFRNATYETASSVVAIATRNTVPTPAVTTAYNLLVGYIAQDENDNFPSMEMATLNSETGAVPWLVGVEVVPAGQYNRFFGRGGSDTNASAVLVVLKTP